MTLTAPTIVLIGRKTASAAEVLERAAQLAPGDCQPLIALSYAQGQLGQPDAARATVNRIAAIGAVYLANPELAKNNLTLEEIEKVFKRLGPVYFFNVSGGEPFMRPDLAEIIRLACVHLKPSLVHIPTNSISPKFIDKTTRKILGYMGELLPASVPISIKPSPPSTAK